MAWNITVFDEDYSFKIIIEKDKNFKGFVFCNCIFYTDVDLSNIDLKVEKEIDENDRQALIVDVFIHELQKSIYDLMIAANLSYPGFWEFDEGYIMVDNKIYCKINTMISGLLDVHLFAIEKKWPQMEILCIENTWKWLAEKTEFLDGMSNSGIDRALNALTYTFNTQNYEDLFYSLLGIEAIYNTDGKTGIMEQIRVKSAILLGEPQEYKNRIRDMYDKRSSFVHGKMNFPNKYFIYDATEEFNKFIFKDYIETCRTAQAILIATLQKFIINNANELESKLIVNFR